MKITFLKKSMLWTLSFSQTAILICSKFIYVSMFWKLIFLFTQWHRCNLRDLCWIFCQFVNVKYRSFFSLPWNVVISRPANSFCRSIIMKYYQEVLSINVRCRFHCKMQNITPHHAGQNRSKTNISKFRTLSIAAASFLLMLLFKLPFIL